MPEPPGNGPAALPGSRYGATHQRDNPPPADEEEKINPRASSSAAGQALARITRQHREILVETYFRGRTVNEAANLLGIPTETASSRLYYALRELAAVLQSPGRPTNG